MAQWHLEELRAALSQQGWRVTQELPGDDYEISGTWQVERAGNRQPLLIDFEGQGDMNVLPLERSYGCRLRAGDASLYFRRRGTNDPKARERWVLELSNFVESLNVAV